MSADVIQVYSQYIVYSYNLASHDIVSFAQSCNCLAFSARTPGRPKRTYATVPPAPPTSKKVVSGTNPAVLLAPDEKPVLPHIAAGYSDGTVRMFDLNRVEMILKMHPHAVPVTAISFASDGESY